VEDRFRPDGVEDLVRLPDVRDVQLRPVGDAPALPLREIVERVHLIAAGEQGLHDM
jgi:hypothetical protein